jgi:hypothetical protein
VRSFRSSGDHGPALQPQEAALQGGSRAGYVGAGKLSPASAWLPFPPTTVSSLPSSSAKEGWEEALPFVLSSDRQSLTAACTAIPSLCVPKTAAVTGNLDQVVVCSPYTISRRAWMREREFVGRKYAFN